MKRFMTLFVALSLYPLLAHGDGDPEVVITLKGGSVAEGKLRSYANGTYILLSEGRELTFPAKEVVAIKTKALIDPPVDAEHGVIITMKDGSTVEGILRGFGDGEYVVDVNGEQRILPLDKVSTVKTAEPKAKGVKAEPEPRGYMLLFTADEKTRGSASAWKKASAALRKRLEAMGVKSDSISSDKTSLIVRLNKISRDFADKLASIVSARGEIALYVEASLTELEKERYKYPDAPEGKKWITHFKEKEAKAPEKAPGAAPNDPPKPIQVDPAAPFLPRPSAVSADDKVHVVFDKPLFLQTIAQSVEDKKEGITFVCGAGGVNAIQNLCKNDKSKLYLCVDDVFYRGFTASEVPVGRIALGTNYLMREDDLKLIKLYYDTPLTAAITAEVVPIK